MPNRLASLPQSSRESAGRRAGVGQSDVAIAAMCGGVTRKVSACSKMAHAKPCQLTAPLPAA